jgi:hypothetical protein
MNSADLELITRQSAGIGDAAQYTDYDTARMLSELNDKLKSVFEDIVVKSRSGYWLHETTFSATIGKNRYRIPARAVVGGLESISINSTPGGAFYEIDQVPVNDLIAYEGTPGRLGQPVVYAVIGDQIEMIPTPSTAIQIKFTYYIRPSQLVAAQSPGQFTPAATTRGLITSVNTASRLVTVAVLPFDQNASVPAAITTGSTIDIVHPDGWSELSLVSCAATIAGAGPASITLGLSAISGGLDDLSDVQVGDYVRAAGQTDWPCLPVDFHRCLCDTAAVKLLIELHLGEKAALVGDNNGNDLKRFRSLLYPRVKSAPKQAGIMRRSRGGGSFGRFYG